MDVGSWSSASSIHETVVSKVSKLCCANMAEDSHKRARSRNKPNGILGPTTPRHFCRNTLCCTPKRARRARRCKKKIHTHLFCFIDNFAIFIVFFCARRYIEYYGMTKLYAQYKQDVYMANKGTCVYKICMHILLCACFFLLYRLSTICCMLVFTYFSCFVQFPKRKGQWS